MREGYLKYGVLVICFLSAILSGYTQKNGELFIQHKFHNLGEEQGLLDNVINDIVQDNLGYIWVATDGGLFRYLGNKFQVYKKERNNDHSLPHNVVYRVFIDSQNQVWALTGDGVALYNYEQDDLVRYQPQQINGGILTMAEYQGDYLFGGYEASYLASDGKVEKLLLKDYRTGQDLSKERILSFKLIDNKLWIFFSFLGVAQYDLESKDTEFFPVSDMIRDRYLEIFDVHLNGQEAWISTDRGILNINLTTGSGRAMKIGDDFFPKDDYLSISQDDQGTFWVGSRQNGAYSFRSNGSEDFILVDHLIPKEDNSGISHRTVSKVMQDNNGFMWLGTHNGGINVFHPEGENVRFLTRGFDKENSLSYENVWGIAESHDGSIWVGTDGKGLNKLNPRTGEITHPYAKELQHVAILSALEDNKERLWLGTYENGVYLIDLRSGTIKNFYARDGVGELRSSDVRTIHQMPDGTVCIGLNFDGVYYFDEEVQAFKYLSGSSNIDVRAMAIVGSRHFMGTFNNGLVVRDWKRSPNHFETLAKTKQDQRLVITSICHEGDTIWMATKENGLVAYDLYSGNYHYFPENHVLRNVSISGVSNDREGNLWLTTNRGIYVYERSSKTFKLFDYRDGIQLGHFNYNSILLSKNGYLIAGGINGMNLFYPDELLKENTDLEVNFHGLKVLNEKVTPGNSSIFNSGKSIFLSDEITLGPEASVFVLSYSSPGFSVDKQSKFEYMLKGYDHDWQINHENSEVTYKNVMPGHYTFRVRSIYDGGHEKQLKISITPPIWKTWQAYLLYMVIIGLITWWINRFSNSRAALKQKLEFEQELREREKEAMQEKLRFYTNFSHELKTPLTLIQGPVNDLFLSTKDPKERRYLTLIKKNTNVLLRFINRMLEFRKIEINKSILNVGKHDLKVLAQEEAESFSYLAREKEIKFGFYCQNSLEAWLDLEKIQIVMNNLLSNAFKFTPAGKAVNFAVFEENEMIVIEVKDDGVGINEEEQKLIFSPFYQASNSYSTGGTGIGLALSKSFVELHKGMITLESKEGVGTKFTVKIPVDKERFDSVEHVRFIDAAKAEAELLISDITSMEDVSQLQEQENERLMLIVDDNKDIANYIESIFENEYKVIKAENGVVALDIAVNNTPDIIISDLMMPKMDGLEFTKEIKSNISTSHIPIIMVTAKDSKHDQVMGYEVGVDGYITKPFSSEVLIARVNNLLKNREMLEIRYESNDLIDVESAKSTREAAFVLEAEKITLMMLENSEFSVPQLCKELGMSQSALYRKIKSLTGVSIQVFIRKIRIKRAAQLLLLEDMTVTEIAFSLEFADLKYFRKCFKEQFGKSPSEYRAEFNVKSESNMEANG